VEELFDYAVAFSKQPLPKGRRVAIVTNAGGPGIMATDACVRFGLELSAFQPETTAHLRKGLPPTANLHNPVDVIGDAQHDRYEHVLGSVLADPNVDGLIVILTPQAMTDIETIAQTVVEAAKVQQKPVLASFMGVMDVSAGVKVLERHGVPHYKFPEGACRALASMARYVTWLERPRTEVRCFVVDRPAAQAVIDRVRAEERCNLVEVEAGNILKAYNIPVVESTIAGTVGEAETVASRVGYPVVIKIASPDILHKADVRGVAVGIEDAEQLRRAHQRMMASAAAAAPTAKILGVTVQPMMRGREVIIGMKRDERFGPMVMFGLGGTYVEVFKDVTFRLAPIREYGADRMVRSIKASKILNGFRGEPPADLEAVKECLLRVSQLAMDLRDVEELDINPLVVFERGKGCMALDARIVLSQQATAPKRTELQVAAH
jgi:acetyltransferase